VHLRGRRTFTPIEQATRPAGVLCGMGWGDQVPLNGSGTPYLELPQIPSQDSRSPSPDILGLPASTAPARLQEEALGAKRKRKPTVCYIEVTKAGLPSLGYSQ
jgi:hypothetical protein